MMVSCVLILCPHRVILSSFLLFLHITVVSVCLPFVLLVLALLIYALVANKDIYYRTT